MNRRLNTILQVAVLIALVIALLIFAGCKGEKEFPQVRYRGGWFPSGNNLADWATLGEGYFEEEGIEVLIIKGSGQDDATMLTAAGEYEFGGSKAIPAILGIAQGMPIKVVALEFQHEVLGLMALESSGIQTPKDIEGKRTAVYARGDTSFLWKKFIEVNDLDISTITEIEMPFGVEPLLADQVDVIGGSILNEPFKIEEPIVLFPFRDYAGTDRIVNCLIVNTDFEQKYPDQVRAFVKAFIRGMAFTMAHPYQAADHLVAYNPDLEVYRESLYQAAEIIGDIYVSEYTEKHGLGYSSPEQWQAMVDWLIEEGLLASPLPVEDIFTNEYLPDPPVLAP